MCNEDICDEAVTERDNPTTKILLGFELLKSPEGEKHPDDILSVWYLHYINIHKVCKGLKEMLLVVPVCL